MAAPSRMDIITARTQFTSEVSAVCAASQNTGLSPELVQAYALLSSGAGSIWLLYADKGLTRPRLQYLYASRHVLGILLRAVGLDVDYGEAGVTENLSAEFSHFLSARQEFTADIAALESQLRASSGFAVGQMTTVQPIAPPTPYGPDGNAGRYRGSPYPSFCYRP